MRQTAPRVDVVGFLQETRQEIQTSLSLRFLLPDVNTLCHSTLGM